MLLAREISCSRSNVLVPVSAWSSPAESVSRSRCISAISLTVWSYSLRSSARRSSSASRICWLSAAVRVPRLVGVLAAVFDSALLSSVVFGAAVLAMVAPSAVGADFAGVVPVVLFAAFAGVALVVAFFCVLAELVDGATGDPFGTSAGALAG